MKSNEMGIKDGFLTIGKVCKTELYSALLQDSSGFTTDG